MQQPGASLPHTQVNINDFPSVANNLLTECWDAGACSVTRVTWLHDEVLSGCMTRACWCMTKCSLSALASAEQVPVRGGASTARAAEPGCNKRSLESTSIYTIYLHNISTLSTAWAGPGVHVCIILEFTQSPDPDLELAGPWMALKIVGWWAEGGRGWRCAGIFTSTLEAMVDTGAQASAGSMNGREKLLRIPHMIHCPLDIRHLGRVSTNASVVFDPRDVFYDLFRPHLLRICASFIRS